MCASMCKYIGRGVCACVPASVSRVCVCMYVFVHMHDELRVSQRLVCLQGRGLLTPPVGGRCAFPAAQHILGLCALQPGVTLAILPHPVHLRLMLVKCLAQNLAQDFHSILCNFRNFMVSRNISTCISFFPSFFLPTFLPFFLSLFFSSSASAGGHTQGLVHAGQALHH